MLSRGDVAGADDKFELQIETHGTSEILLFNVACGRLKTR